MRRAVRTSIYLSLAAGMLGSCSNDSGRPDAGPPCIAAGGAQVCCAVDRGRLVMTAEGLQAGSTLRIDLEGQGSAEWTVSEAGTVLNAPGSLGFLTYDGSVGTVSIEATAADGTPVTGQVVID